MAALIFLAVQEIVRENQRGKEKKRSNQQNQTETTISTLSNLQISENLPSYSPRMGDGPPSYMEAVLTGSESIPSISAGNSTNSSQQQPSTGNNATISPYDCLPTIPKDILDSIDWGGEDGSTFNTSIKPYHRHVFLCVNSNPIHWPCEAGKLNNRTLSR